jgi:outer membrane receptor protein involved in Fe transport
LAKLHKSIWLAAALVVFCAESAWAVNVGKISGTVTDETSGEPIIGAAVAIVGTPIGSLTDVDGRFIILNVPVGTYTLRASLVGYTSVEYANVSVSVDLTTYQNFSLKEQAVELGAVTVTVERPLVHRDRTSSIRLIDEEMIQNLPTRGYQDVVGLQAGSVRFADNVSVNAGRGASENTTTGSVYVRGGRASEVAYYVDGFSQQDPLTGLSTTQINNNSIKEISVVTGGFNAEYGLIMSGAVNVTTKEGGDAYHGTVEAVTDNFHGDNFDYNVYSGVLSGPIIRENNQLTFYVAGERRWARDRDPRARTHEVLPTNQLLNNYSGLWNWQAKTAWRPNSDVVVRLGSNGSVEKWRAYYHEYLFNVEHMPRYDDRNFSFFGEITHTLNPKTFYTAKANWFSTERTNGDGVYFDDLWAYGRPSGNPRNDDEDLYRAWDDMNLNADSLENHVIYREVTETVTEMREVELPDGTMDSISFVVSGDESHVWDGFIHRQSSYIGGDIDLVSQIHPNHELKLGAEVQRHTLRRYEHYFPTQIYLGVNGGFDDANFYGYNELGEEGDPGGLNDAKRPINLAGYFQDKFEWEGMVLNAGLRLDYFDYRTERLRDPERPLDPDGFLDPEITPDPTEDQLLEAQRLTESDLTTSESVARVSPRLGVAFPISDGSVLHFSYGKFFQRPDLENLYVNYDYLEYKIRTGGYFVAFGNPNLEPEETTAYEFGWRRQMNDYTAVDVTAFYKDIKNLTEVINQPTEPNSFATYRNRDFGTVKGLELQLDMRRIHGVSGQVNYTLSFAEGTGSFANTKRNIAWTADEAPTQVSLLDFDQRHNVSGVIDIRAGAQEGPKIGDMFPLERAGVNFVFTAGSGFPYTPTTVYNEVTLGAVSPDADGQINSGRTPWLVRFDMKANKEFVVGRGFNLDIYFWVINIFDRDNVVDVYESTGEADRTGWLDTPSGREFADAHAEGDDASFIGSSTTPLSGEQKYEVRQLDPRNYDTPRQIRFGARWTF